MYKVIPYTNNKKREKLKSINTLLLLIIALTLLVLTMKVSQSEKQVVEVNSALSNKDNNVQKCNIPNQTAHKVSQETAHYPDQSEKMGEEGIVILRIKVNQIGTPKKVEVEKSSGHFLLDQSALVFAQNSIFAPTIKDCSIVETDLRMPVTFKLE